MTRVLVAGTNTPKAWRPRHTYRDRAPDSSAGLDLSCHAAAAWVAKRDAEKICLTAVSEAELLRGVATMPHGRRRSALEDAMSRWLGTGFRMRILLPNSAAARA